MNKVLTGHKEMTLEEFRNDSELRELRRLKEYFDSLQGTGLYLLYDNDVESFDNYYSRAKKYVKAPPLDVSIAIDIDDVMNNLCEAWCEWLDKKYHTNIKVSDVTEWDICKFFPSLTKSQVFEPLTQESFWKTVKPKEGAVKYIKKLMDYGFSIYLCSATDYRNVRMKYEIFIQKYFPYIKWEQVIITSHKEMINAQIFIDDNPDNLIRVKTWLRILMDAPHNRGCDTEKPRLLRANDWKHIYERLAAVY